MVLWTLSSIVALLATLETSNMLVPLPLTRQNLLSLRLLLPWRGCSVTLRQNGSKSGWLLGLLVSPRHRRYRLLGGCPISLRVGICFDSLSRPFRHLPLSIMHLLSKCNINSLRDSRSHLVKERRIGLVLVRSVATKATMPGSVHKTSLPSLLSPQLTPA